MAISKSINSKFLNKFIGDRAFYKMAMTVAVPIMIQNFITNFVSMLDNLMVGRLGTEQMSGVSIVNQLIFIFGLAVFGALSGAGIFTAQFYGKNDKEGIRHTIRYKAIITTLLFTVATVIFLQIHRRRNNFKCRARLVNITYKMIPRQGI